MALQQQQMTAAAFDAFAERPENRERIFELIDGEIVEKMPTNIYASAAANLISFFIRLYLRQHNLLGQVTDGTGGYMVDRQRYAPDVAYLAGNAPLTRRGYHPAPPQFAVEVESNVTAASAETLSAKLTHYLAAGTVVWVVYADEQRVEIHMPGQPPQLFSDDNVLTGGALLPGFTLPVRDIFPQ